MKGAGAMGESHGKTKEQERAREKGRCEKEREGHGRTIGEINREKELQSTPLPPFSFFLFFPLVTWTCAINLHVHIPLPTLDPIHALPEVVPQKTRAPGPTGDYILLSK